ncbi:MAG: tyrosine-type recombinase/integrase [Candidatus Accumulibacter sp.]|nr:tyrosine-type recombinase/integrase [Accumulibacter sp.]
MRATYLDTKVVGLQLRVSSTGTKTFSVFRRIKGGQPERVTLGKFPAMTVEQARKAAAEVSAAIEGGANPAEAKRVLKKEMTLSEFFTEKYVLHGTKKKSWRDDQQRFRDYLQKPLGNLRLSEITRAMVAHTLSDAEKAGKSVATVRQLRALASVIFRVAEEKGEFSGANPARVRITGATVKRRRFLQHDEMPRFFAAVAEESDTMRDFILLAILTGVRRGNLCAMRWQDVDLRMREWTIPETKNGEPQIVALCPEAVTILQERQVDTSVWVFPGIGKTGHIVEVQGAVERVMKRAGIPYGRKAENGVTLHDLRRTLGSWQARNGASLTIIGKSLNHKSPQSTAIYAQLDIDPVRQSVEAATAAMLEAGGFYKSGEVMATNRKRG